MSGVALKGGSEIFRGLLTFADILTYGQNGLTKIKFTTINIGFWTLFRSLIVNESFNLILQVLPRVYSKSINLSLICIYLIGKENVRSTGCWVSHCLQASSKILRTPPNTSPVERGYTYLQIPAAKRKNHMSNENLQVLFLLVVLKVWKGNRTCWRKIIIY